MDDCSQPSGYIMGHHNYGHYFSGCSDKTISTYVLSEEASCLRKIDNNDEPVINGRYATPIAPSRDELCKTKNGPESFLYYVSLDNSA